VVSDRIFPAERYEEDGTPFGFNEAELCRAVELWFYARDIPATIGCAALAFNVSPEFLAGVIDRHGGPFFFASEAALPAMRSLDCDGI
jgi:hypothetical protein